MTQDINIFMINKYTLIFKDPKLEGVFQEYVNRNIRIPLFKKLIISSSVLTIIEILQKLAYSNHELLDGNNIIKYGLGFVLEICFFLIYHLRPQCIKYALLFYNHLLVLQFTTMDSFPQSQQLVYVMGIMIYQIVNALFGEFMEAVYQTVAFGSFYLMTALWNSETINFNLIALIVTAMIILISAFYENIRALRSQFKLGKIDNQWELIFKSLVTDKEYMVFYYDEKSYSFTMNQQYLCENVSNTQELRNYLRQMLVERKTLEQFIFEKINQNTEQNNIINEEIILKNKKINYSIFYGFHTIILLQFRNYCENKQFKQEAIERLYQFKFKKFLALMMQLVRRFSENENSIILIYKMRKYCVYTHLKEMILQNGQLIISEINFNQISKTLQLLFYEKNIIFQNTTDTPILGSQQYILLILIEILERSLSQEIIIKLEQNFWVSFTVQIFCNLNSKTNNELNKRIRSYLPLLQDVQFQIMCVTLTFATFYTRDEFTKFFEEQEIKQNIQNEQISS